MNKTTQDDIFLKGEGTNWFIRNKHALKSLTFDPVLHLLDLYGLKPKSVLDVGSSNGWRLDLIRKRGAKVCFGVDASKEAIQDGLKRYPKLKLAQSSAANMPLGKRQFDLVVVNFVLHWVSRETLPKIIKEIDGRVRPGGYLIVGDFYPDKAGKNAYHHLPGKGVWTYKDFYAAKFVAKKTYTDVAHFALEFGTYKFVPAVSGQDRIGYWLLRKNPAKPVKK